MIAFEAFGCFGKLPISREFVIDRAPDLSASGFDTWVSEGMALARGPLGARFKPLATSFPLYRYAWSGASRKDRFLYGDLVPSEDAAGRIHPFTVFGVIERGTTSTSRETFPLELFGLGDELKRIRDEVALAQAPSDVLRAVRSRRLLLSTEIGASHDGFLQQRCCDFWDRLAQASARLGADATGASPDATSSRADAEATQPLANAGDVEATQPFGDPRNVEATPSFSGARDVEATPPFAGASDVEATQPFGDATSARGTGSSRLQYQVLQALVETMAYLRGRKLSDIRMAIQYPILHGPGAEAEHSVTFWLELTTRLLGAPLDGICCFWTTPTPESTRTPALLVTFSPPSTAQFSPLIDPDSNLETVSYLERPYGDPPESRMGAALRGLVEDRSATLADLLGWATRGS